MHSKVSCKEWPGCTNNQGYGQVRVNGHTYLAHRLAYVNAHGLTLDDIKGKVVRHSCDNRKCVEPLHLDVGTQGQNLCDRKDHGHVYRKLTQADANVIKLELAAGVTAACLAREYGVSDQMISHIKHGRQWA